MLAGESQSESYGFSQNDFFGKVSYIATSKKSVILAWLFTNKVFG
jgi:hypothetical protein